MKGRERASGPVRGKGISTLELKTSDVLSQLGAGGSQQALYPEELHRIV